MYAGYVVRLEHRRNADVHSYRPLTKMLNGRSQTIRIGRIEPSGVPPEAHALRDRHPTYHYVLNAIS